jgi:hypothetical protein
VIHETWDTLDITIIQEASLLRQAVLTFRGSYDILIIEIFSATSNLQGRPGMRYVNDPDAKVTAHRSLDRYRCPPSFRARICSATIVEEEAKVENMSARGLSIRTCCEFVPGSNVEIELKSGYAAPVKLHARVRWVSPQEKNESARLVGFSIRKVGVIEWFRYRKVLAQLKKELW